MTNDYDNSKPTKLPAMNHIPKKQIHITVHFVTIGWVSCPCFHLFDSFTTNDWERFGLK